METQRSDSNIGICFNNQTGDKVFYKVRPNVKIQSLVRQYCRDKHLEYEAHTFLHCGNRLPTTGTVQEAGLENHNEIDVMRPASGGGTTK